MKKFVLVILAIFLVCGTVYAQGCPEEGTFYEEDDFGDISDNFFVGTGHFDGTYKTNKGATGTAGLHFILNNYNKDVILTVQDRSHYDSDWYQTVWDDYDCYLSYGSDVIDVKIKFSNGKVETYKGKLMYDELVGTGKKRFINVPAIYDKIIDEKDMSISLSNSACSYTYKGIYVPEEDKDRLRISGRWNVVSSEVEDYKNCSITIYPGKHSRFIEKKSGEKINIGYGWNEVDGNRYFYMTPGTKDDGPFYSYTFSQNNSSVTLKDMTSGKKVVMNRI